MQINLYPSTKNISNCPQITEKKSCSTPVSFCGADVFERGAFKFSKELCIKTINKIFSTDDSAELSEAVQTIKDLKKSDLVLIELDRLAYKYLDTLSLDDKKNLLRH